MVALARAVAIALACAACSSPRAPECDPGFDGADCAHPTLRATPVAAALRDAHASFWDGSAIRGDDGRWHLFASRFANGCGLSAWKTNSECVRAVADAPLGPYAVEETVVPAFCHNPSIRRANDGAYLLYSIGQLVDPSTLVSTCMDGRTLALPPSSGLVTSVCTIRVQSAPSVRGPWSAPVEITNAGWVPLCPTNPAPVVNDDGSIALFFRAYQLGDGGAPVERLFRSDAPSWRGPYTFPREPLFLREAEDPFVWRAGGRGLRMLYNDKFTDPANVGGLALANDEATWATAGSAYALDVAMSDGTTLHVSRRERPSIAWTPDRGAVLFTAIAPSSGDDGSYVIATPLTSF
jgi:hypothetical protein